MGTKAIPQFFLHTCDGCGAEVKNAEVQRPKYWADLIIHQDAYDYQGCAVADGSVRRLLCGDCKKKVADAINTAIMRV